MPSLPSVPVCVLRHIATPQKKTTFRLEKQFWAQIDRLASKSGRTWQQWVIKTLATKPADSTGAQWLRVQCLKQSLKGRK
jgi:predicted DNA-binding ribbon-helix-helix protein